MTTNIYIKFPAVILINILVLLSSHTPVQAQQKVKLFHAQDVRLTQSVFKDAENTEIRQRNLK